MTRERTIKMGAMALLITMIVGDLGDGPLRIEVWSWGLLVCCLGVLAWEGVRPWREAR